MLEISALCCFFVLLRPTQQKVQAIFHGSPNGTFVDLRLSRIDLWKSRAQCQRIALKEAATQLISHAMPVTSAETVSGKTRLLHEVRSRRLRIFGTVFVRTDGGIVDDDVFGGRESTEVKLLNELANNSGARSR